MVTFFLVTFLVGFGLTVISALLGSLHIGGDLSHGHGGIHLGHGDAGHIDLGHGHGGHADAGHGHGGADAQSVSAVNFQTLVAFMMGFGGVGYIASRFGIPGLILMLLLAMVGGFATAWIIYRFLKLLVRGEREMPPTSYIGVVGQLSVPIREGGTGELIYRQNDVTQVMAARSHDGSPLAKGEEVVVLRHENGVAYVQRFREFMEREQK